METLLKQEWMETDLFKYSDWHLGQLKLAATLRCPNTDTLPRLWLWSRYSRWLTKVDRKDNWPAPSYSRLHHIPQSFLHSVTNFNQILNFDFVK